MGSEFVQWFKRFGPSLLAAAALTLSTVTATTVTTTGSVVTNTISERTAAAGVTVDGVLLKDTAVTADSLARSSAGNLSLSAPASGTVLIRPDNGAGVLTISESGTGDVGLSVGANVLLQSTAGDATLESVDSSLILSAGAWLTTSGALTLTADGILLVGALDSEDTMRAAWDGNLSEIGQPTMGTSGGAVAMSFAPGGTTETLAAAVDLAAGSIDDAGGVVRVHAWGIAAANTNSKIVRLRYGANGSGVAASLVGACTFASASDTTWRATWLVQAQGGSLQRAVVTCDGAATDAQSTTTTAIDPGAITELVFTVHNATAGSDLTVQGYYIEFIR